MAAIAVDGNLISLTSGIIHHRLNRCRFVVIRADVHALDAKALIVTEKLHLREIRLLLSGRFADGPMHVLLRNEIGQTDHRDETETVLVCIVDFAVLRPPQAFERRHDILEAKS